MARSKQRPFGLALAITAEIRDWQVRWHNHVNAKSLSGTIFNDQRKLFKDGTPFHCYIKYISEYDDHFIVKTAINTYRLNKIQARKD